MHVGLVGLSKTDEARRIGKNCPVGYLVFLERDTGRVYYRDVHSNNEIDTDFAAEHVDIAHDFSGEDPDSLEWDFGNSTLNTPTGLAIDVYRAKGK
jgi:hypothetical protein